jgi:hypothetical protein
LDRVRWIHAHRAELQDIVSGVVQSPLQAAAGPVDGGALSVQHRSPKRTRRPI